MYALASVSVSPGANTLEVMPCFPNSWASYLEKVTKEDFAIAKVITPAGIVYLALPVVI